LEPVGAVLATARGILDGFGPSMPTLESLARYNYEMICPNMLSVTIAIP